MINPSICSLFGLQDGDEASTALLVRVLGSQETKTENASSGNAHARVLNRRGYSGRIGSDEE